MKIVAITGAPGVGKTEVARAVTRALAPSIGLDLDDIAWLQPWTVDENLYQLMAANLRSFVANARAAGIGQLVVSGVMLPGRLLPYIADLLADEDLSWRMVGLRASPETIRERVAGDTKGQDPDSRLMWVELDAEVAGVPNVVQIDTNELELGEVVAAVLSSLDSPIRLPRARRADVTIMPVVEARAMATSYLERNNFDPESARVVADELIDNSVEGYHSHGVLRLTEYVDANRLERRSPTGTPVVTRHEQVALLDGNGVMGLMVRRSATMELMSLTNQFGIGLVSIRRGGHLGRLGKLADVLGREGFISLGFANYSGAGQRVVPWGSTVPKLASNPLLLAYPGDPPVVLDMSTSSVAEGEVRRALLSGQLLSRDFLVLKDGTPSRDPRHLYSGEAAILPMGGEQGYKGFGLAVLIDLIAGVLSGGGTARASAEQADGNSAIFIGIDPRVFGRTSEDVKAALQQVEEFLADSTGQVRLPGRRRAEVSAFVAIPNGTLDEMRGGHVEP